MAVKANVLKINSLKPRHCEYETAIAEHRGLIVTVYPTGTRTFGLRYRQDGALRRIALDVASLSEARSAWLKHREEIKRGSDPAAVVRSERVDRQLKRQAARAAPTVQSLASDFIRIYSMRRKKSWRADELMLQNAVLPEWGAIQAKEIRRRDVIALLDRIAERTPVRANRVLAVVRKMFAWAVERDVLSVSPCAGVKSPGAEVSRSRVLSDEEIKTVWAELTNCGVPRATHSALKLQLATGQRIGEVVGAMWSEIDLKKREWLIPAERAKNGRENLVPLSDLAVSILSEVPQSGSSFAFSALRKHKALRIDVVTHQLHAAIKQLGLAHFTSHDLRRTAATRLAEMGTSRVVLDAILNHVDRSIGAVYDRHNYAPEKRRALDAWAIKLHGLVINGA